MRSPSINNATARTLLTILLVGASSSFGCGETEENGGELNNAEIIKNTFALDANQKLVAAIEEHGCTLNPDMSFTNKLPWGGYAYMGTGGCEESGKRVSLITYLSPEGVPYATIASVKYVTPPAPGSSGKTTSSMSIIRVDEEGNVTETPWSDEDFSQVFLKFAELFPEVQAAVEEYQASQANNPSDDAAAARAALGSPNLGNTGACEACDNFLPALEATDEDGKHLIINGGSINCNKDCCSCQSDADICAGYYASADRGVKSSIKVIQGVQLTTEALGIVGSVTAIIAAIAALPTGGLSVAGGFVLKKAIAKIKSVAKEYAIVALLAEAGIVIEFYYSKVYDFFDLFKGPCGFESACFGIDDCTVEPECSVRVTLEDGSTDWSKSGMTRSGNYLGLADLAVQGKTCGIVDVVECFATGDDGKPISPENCPPEAKARYKQTNFVRWDNGDVITYAQGMVPTHCPTGECTITDPGTCHFGCTETSWTFNSRAEAEAALSCAHIGPIPFHY